MTNSDYMKKRQQQKTLTSAVNPIVSKVIGYDRKTPDIWDFYEGEYPLDWIRTNAADPLRLVFQATVGAHGRHGDNKPDRAVAQFVKESILNKRKYGLYHLVVPNDIPQQAQFYINTVESLGGLGNMMPIGDVEVDWLRGTAWADMVAQWVDLVQTHFNQTVLMYTSKYYASFMNDRNGNPPAFLSKLYYWGAGYLFMPYIDSNPLMPHAYLANGFKDWAVWQYFDKARSSPPRTFDKFPANDVNLTASWFVNLLESL